MLASPGRAADRRHPARRDPGRGRAAAAAPARPGSAAARDRGARARPAASTLARELYRAIVLQRAADDHGVHPPFDGAALLQSIDEETASLARALYAKPGPDPRTLDPRHLAYEITRLLLELEDDQLRERSDYNESAQAEAEREGDTDSIERLMLEGRQINEARRSLDRRRDETRLLARPTAAVRA